MYLQITTKCNMTCEHCCFACTAKGDTMDMKTVENALKLAENYGEDITIGGGEPTIHPKLFEIIGLALSYNYSEMPVLVVTNGKIKKRALRLGRMARNEVISVDLSQTDFHDPIDPEVVHYFSEKLGSSGIRSIEGENVISTGRADNWGINEDGCTCNTVMVTPTGDIKFCGHLEAPVLGNVNDKNAEKVFEEITDIKYEYGVDCYQDIEPAKYEQEKVA